jgi:hypothetical protein
MASNWKSRVETVRLVFELPQSSDRVNAALFLSGERRLPARSIRQHLPNAFYQQRKHTKEIRGKLPRTTG